MNLIDLIRLLASKKKAQSQVGELRKNSNMALLRHLNRILSQAQVCSPFYAERLRGIRELTSVDQLREIQVLTKTELLENFDRVVTTDRISRGLVQRKIAQDQTKFAGFRLMTTSGTTGARSLFVLSHKEWLETMSSYLRAYEMAGRQFQIHRRTRTAIVGSDQPWHQSTQISDFAQSPWFPTLQLNVLSPESEIIRELNRFQPEALGGYSGFVRILALAQLEGRLKISPRSIICSAEALSDETRQLCRHAWGVEPFNLYASTECGVMAMECDRHDGLHLFVDRIHFEVVDQNHNPVSAGELGSKLLITHLHNRTLPLIRYEMSDCLKLRSESCPCGNPLPLIEAIEGRAQDRLTFQDRQRRERTIHPSVLYAMMEREWIQNWQVRHEEPTKLKILISGEKAQDPRMVERVEQSFRQILQGADLDFIETQVLSVPEIPKGNNGKRQLIVRPSAQLPLEA